MSERSERVRILTRITVIISISLLLVTAGSASCHDDRSPYPFVTRVAGPGGLLTNGGR